MGRRFALFSAIAAGVALCGCAPGGWDAVLTTPNTLVASTPPSDAGSGGASVAALQKAAASAQAQGPSDEAPLPGGELFDNSRGEPALLGEPAGVSARDYAPESRGFASARAAGPRPRRGEKAPPSPQLALASEEPKGGRLAGAGPVLAAFDSFQRRSYADVAEVFSRLAWGAAAPRGRQKEHHPTHVTVHHTAGRSCTKVSDSIKEMQGYQADHMYREHEWGDIGYHFVIDGAGRIFEGRHTDILGTHAGGANLDNIGIAVMGNYNVEELNERQKTTLRRLIAFLALRYGSDTSRRDFIQPHSHYKGTDCPGSRILAFLQELRRQVNGEAVSLALGQRPEGAAASFVPLAIVSAQG